MSDEAERTDMARVVLLSGWALTLLACVSIIGAAVYTAIVTHDMTPIREWAGTCLGFLLGNVFASVKDFIKATP